LEAVGRDRNAAQKHVAQAKAILTTAARYGPMEALERSIRQSRCAGAHIMGKIRA
jgi:hypothetical protein